MRTVSREAEVWAATRVIAMHTGEDGPGRCAHCTRDGCRMQVWAAAIRRQWAEEGNDLPPVDPPRPSASADGNGWTSGACR